MSSSMHLSSEEARSHLRSTVETVAREIAHLPGVAAGEVDRHSVDLLRSSFADLTEQLALGPEPEVRDCPVCRHVARRAATRCGYCWTELARPGEALAEDLHPLFPRPGKPGRQRAPGGEPAPEPWPDLP